MMSSAERHERCWWYLYQQSVKDYDLQPDLHFEIFKRHPKRDIFECIS